MRTIVSFKILLVLGLLSTACGGEASSPPDPQNTCNVKVEWEYPVNRLDGTPLTIQEIAKLTIYISASEGGDDDDLIRIEDVTASNGRNTYVLHWVPQGLSWYTLTVTDTEGRESQVSNEIPKLC